MGKNDTPMSREEYEQKVEKHIAAIRRLMKQFNPEAYHVTMAIVGDSQWATTYLPDDEDGTSRKVSDWYRKTTDSNGCGPFFRSEELPDEQ